MPDLSFSPHTAGNRRVAILNTSVLSASVKARCLACHQYSSARMMVSTRMVWARISRILRSVLHVRCVVVDLPEQALARKVKRAEVVLMVRIVVLVEGVKVGNQSR